MGVRIPGETSRDIRRGGKTEKDGLPKELEVSSEPCFHGPYITREGHRREVVVPLPDSSTWSVEGTRRCPVVTRPKT